MQDNITVVASNRSSTTTPKTTEIAAGMLIDSDQAIADTGATSIFIMEGVDVDNKRLSKKPLKINLPDGNIVHSTHRCDIEIPGLPKILVGHIVPHLAIASLIGIRPLCKAGCTVTFDDMKCEVTYNGTVILRGVKDPSTDLWTLPIPRKRVGTTPGDNLLPRPGPCKGRAPHLSEHPALVCFAHSIKTRANAVKFTHQSLCNPPISTLLKATRRGFLKGCPNLSEELINKYLNRSPATAKGHMKRPRHGIRSTRAKQPTTKIPQPEPPLLAPVPAYHEPQGPALIAMDDNDSIANIFCFGAFADKTSGLVYHDLTGSFPFVSLDGSVCFFVLYHYESNCIFGTPIAGLDDKTIFKAYKKHFDELTRKGFKPKLNIMDNQATKHIKTFLAENECDLQLVEPHNHRVNAAERAIQTFKDAFIAALATTDVDFPIQLWDKLTPQVETCINLMRRSRIHPTMSAYECMNGPYDWNRYPLAPLGCKAVIYEDGDTRGSWASRGIDGWYLGPSKDHYRCDLYYIPETRAYRISGSTELFPQHCQLPNLTPNQHFKALTNELVDSAVFANTTNEGRRLMKLLQADIQKIIHPVPDLDEQRVRREEEQRVIDNTPILTIPRITDAPPIMQSRNPTAKRAIKTTPRLHRRVTRNNTPGAVPMITRHDAATPVPIQRASPRTTVHAIPTRARQRLVTQQAINVLTIRELATADTIFTPRKLIAHAKTTNAPHFEHFASPMVHPITGETISSYKKLMNDPATAEA